jgi:tRNA threonylcarbamoyladenosine biosynthesis protein TsaB
MTDRLSSPSGTPKILAFDCSGGACSAALLADGRVAAQRLAPMLQGHGERLMPMLREIMAEASLSFAALDAIAVTVGPGRFTGLRVGIAAARGLALATGKPALGIASFAAVEAQARREQAAAMTVLAVIDSGRDEIFAQLFDAAERPQGAPQIATPADLAGRLPAGPLLLAGDGADLVRRALGSRDHRAANIIVAAGPIRAATVAALGAAELARLPRGGPPEPPRPIYLRAPDAKLPGPPP